jgi:hypothetical protein
VYPYRPAFGRILDVLINVSFDAITTQPIGQFEDALGVVVGIVGVTDEDSWRS